MEDIVPMSDWGKRSVDRDARHCCTCEQLNREMGLRHAGFF